MNNIIFLTYATHNERLFNKLIESSKRNNINLNILGYGDIFEGMKGRAKSILKFLNTINNDNQLICHIDAFDSIILGNEQEMYTKFNTFYKDKKLVFSSDNDNNFFFTYFKYKKYGKCHNNFLSAGLYIGYNYYIKNLLEYFIKTDYISDQKSFIPICRIDDNIAVDNNILFYNYQFFEKKYKYENNRLIIGDNMPVIISAPGNVNIVNILNNFGYDNDNIININHLVYTIRNIKYDYKYIWKEILFILLLIIIIYKLIK